MKKMCLMIVTVMISLFSTAQANLKPMIRQIALLQTYIGWLEKGYSIARGGLAGIGDIKNGHWQLDQQFFNSLKNVNPAVKTYAKVTAILLRQKEIIVQCSRLKKQPFNADEVAYIHVVAGHLLNECQTVIDRLTLVLADGQLQLSDDERIRAVDDIYDALSDQYEFIKSFADDAALLIRQRAHEKNDINVSKQFNGL